jgi:ATPase subunit of ABC transporter with duplicated ATPase domains
MSRYFISKVANKIVEIREGGIRDYRGVHHYYLDKIADEKSRQISSLEARKAAMLQKLLSLTANANNDFKTAREVILGVTL